MALTKSGLCPYLELLLCPFYKRVNSLNSKLIQLAGNRASLQNVAFCSELQTHVSRIPGLNLHPQLQTLLHKEAPRGILR